MLIPVKRFNCVHNLPRSLEGDPAGARGGERRMQQKGRNLGGNEGSEGRRDVGKYLGTWAPKVGSLSCFRGDSDSDVVADVVADQT